MEQILIALVKSPVLVVTSGVALGERIRHSREAGRLQGINARVQATGASPKPPGRLAA